MSRHPTTAKLDRLDVENTLFLQALESTGTFDLKVKGGSMTPTLLQGDTVALLFIPEQERVFLELGEVVLSIRAGHFSLHRIVGITAHPRRYLTKGDALAGPDPWCFPEQLIARVKRATTPAGLPFEVGSRPLSVFEKLRMSRTWRLHRLSRKESSRL